MLYTRKGDKGNTSAFGCKQKFSKNSALTEVLGSLDELNSLLGICKIKAADFEFKEPRPKGRGINAPWGGSGCSLTEMSGLRPLSIICGRSSPRQAAGNSAAASVKIIKIIENIQNNLFIIQASIAGADKKITQKKINEIENIIDLIEKKLPLIKSFFLPGGGELAAYLDYSRAIARRAERRLIALSETQKIDAKIPAYLNRLSSLFYALARFVNFKSGVKEIPPKY